MENQYVSSQAIEPLTFDTSDKQNSLTLQQSKAQSLLDFSQMFKSNGFSKRPMPKLGANRKTESQGPNWLLQIPSKLQISIKDLEERRYINQEKWKILVKTNQQNESSIAALMSCFNYLAQNNSSSTSTLPLLKELKNQLLNPNLTRRQIILNCSQLISQKYQIKWLQHKVHQIQEEGKNTQFLTYITQSMKSKLKTFIYICYGQVLCPIGFENTPLVPLDAYKRLEQINCEKLQMWIIFGSPLKTSAPFVIKRWSDVEKEMASRWPQYVDLNETKKGRQTLQQPSDQTDPCIKQISCWIELSFTQLAS